MKIRQGFVSNSSSSSFIVIGSEPKQCKSVLLEEKVARRIFNRIGQPFPEGKEIYVTQFLSDCGSYTDLLQGLSYIDYFDGSLGEEPYDAHEEGNGSFVEVDDGVWIAKEDYFAEKLVKIGTCPHCGTNIYADEGEDSYED